MSGPKPKAEQGVLLFEEEADEDATSDPHLKEKISKYLEEKTSKEPSKKLIHTGPDGEEHTGLTDDSADDEGEPDYDVASRMTLKASSEAFLEVGVSARGGVRGVRSRVWRGTNRVGHPEGTVPALVRAWTHKGSVSDRAPNRQVERNGLEWICRIAEVAVMATVGTRPSEG
ncbi:hypothetical protein PLESTF_000510000 [Pleodorina starrii]|nr:hypothetical protein PLESTF_000510000 [Pleodorina starrii]